MKASSARPLVVTASLCSPLAGDAPQLDGLLELVMCGLVGRRGIDRAGPAPPLGQIPIPILRRRLGEWTVAACTSAVLPDVLCQTERFTRILDFREPLLLGAPRRVSASGTWTKGYRLPLLVRRVRLARWLCLGEPREMRRKLGEVTSIGRKISQGYGRVAQWSVDPWQGPDATWYAAGESGQVLMRALPIGDWLPANLQGARRTYGACCPPYWHPDRYTEIVAPC